MGRSKVYTRTGDKGTTSLVGGKRVSKSSVRIDSYGTVDELNSFIALLLEEEIERSCRECLLEIQSRLFTLGSYLASETGFMSCGISDEEIASLEKTMDEIDAQLPPLKAFVVPGGCKGNALAHVCRTICRRAERTIYRLNETEPQEENALKYINRLSDFFFLLARKISVDSNADEIMWQNTCRS